MRLNYPFHVAVSQGVVDNTRSFTKFGLSNTVNTTESTIWDLGGSYVYPETAVNMSLISTSINDSSLGTGARTLLLIGLNENYEETEELVTLNGTTPVLTTNLFIRTCRMYVLTAGSLGGQDGDITCENNSTVYANMSIGNNQTLMAMCTVPAGKTSFISEGRMSAGSGKNVVGSMFIRPFGGVFKLELKFLIYQGVYINSFRYPLRLPEKTDVEVRATADTPLSDVSAGFDYLLIDN